MSVAGARAYHASWLLHRLYPLCPVYSLPFMNSPDPAITHLREDILRLVSRYHELAHAPKPFVPGQTKVPYAGRVYDGEEMRLGTESILDFWLTAGPFANEFEKQMRDYFGASAAYLVNSGSSANLLMIAT